MSFGRPGTLRKTPRPPRKRSGNASAAPETPPNGPENAPKRPEPPERSGAAVKLELHGASDAGDNVAAHPDLAVLVLGDAYPAASAQGRALAGHVRSLQPAGAEQPLGHRRVQAARDRVLDRADLAAERPDLQRLRRSGRVEPGHADIHGH